MAMEPQQDVSLFSSCSIAICLDNPALDIIMGEEVVRAASSISYHYEAFNDKESIRVLTLYPSKSLSAAIHIKLSIVKVAENPGFEALSYTWGTINGDASLSSIFHCSGGQITATKNCEDALRRLRREEHERTLWVDAICINQKDNEEKARQVAFMGSIYQHASQAVIWLGDASETLDETTGNPLSDLFFDYLAPMAAEMKEMKDDGREASESPLYKELISQASNYVAHQISTPLVQGFLGIVLRPWWERVWVVQEAALSKTGLIICGGKTANYSDLYNLWLTLFLDFAHDAGLTYSLLEGYKHHMLSIHHIKEYSTFLSPANVLLGILDRCRRLRSTDKRDHIFAMFGMFGDFRSKLPVPNYSITSQKAFSDVMHVFFNYGGSFNVLEYVTNILDDKLEYPSWVVDFSQRPKFHIPVRPDLYNACEGSGVVYKVFDDGKELQLLGLCVDVIEHLPKAPIEGYYNPYIPKKAILGYRQSILLGNSLTSYPTGEDPTEVLWRTLCWDADESGQSPSSHSPATPFQHFSAAILSENPIEVIEKDILNEDACGFNDICVHSMPLCTTEDGYLASVPWTAREGDKVFVFCGGQTPFLLRRDERGGMGEREQWRLVGACYVHGIMRGEAFPAPESVGELEWVSIR